MYVQIERCAILEDPYSVMRDSAERRIEPRVRGGRDGSGRRGSRAGELPSRHPAPRHPPRVHRDGKVSVMPYSNKGK